MARRAFDAAGMPPALARWITAASPADNDILAGLRQLRARSRDAAQNDDHMRQFLRMVETNVIGRGVTVQARPRTSSGRYDAPLAARIEDAYREQCERGTWDASGQHTRASAARLGARTVAQDGELLIRIHEGDPDSPTGFSVEMIDAESLDMDYSDTLSNGNLIRMGVEMTPRRRPVAYHLFAEPQPHTGYSSYSGTRRVRVSADDVLHVYLPEWVWGSRGIPWAATALRRMKMLSGYEEAGITAARAAAVKSAVYQSTPDANPEAPPAGASVEAGFAQELTPGAAEMVPMGWELKPLDWNWPNIEHGAFVKEALRGIAGGLGVSYNGLANDLVGVSFSSLRQGALSERDMWMMAQEWWIEWVERPIYRRWLAYAIRTGRIARANGASLDLTRIPALSHADFLGRRWPWVDPLKDLQSAELAIRLRTRSVSDVIREQGRDPETVWAELAADRAKLDALGLALATETPAAPTSEEDPDADAE